MDPSHLKSLHSLQISDTHLKHSSFLKSQMHQKHKSQNHPQQKRPWQDFNSETMHFLWTYSQPKMF